MHEISEPVSSKMSFTISARNTVNSWADVGTLDYKFRYLLAMLSAMSESSENPSSVEGVTLWTESSFFISFHIYIYIP